MAQAFVSALSRPQRTLIQATVCSLLGELKRPAGYLIDVIPFGAVVRSHSDEEGVAMLVDAIGGRAPAIAVAVGDRTCEPFGIGARSFKGYLDILVYHASSNARNQQLGRQAIDGVGAADDRADPGLHVMMEHAHELLLGQWSGGVPAISVKQIWPEREEELATTPAITIWLQTYKVTTTMAVSEWRTATQLLTAIGFTSTGLTDQSLAGGLPADLGAAINSQIDFVVDL